MIKYNILLILIAGLLTGCWTVYEYNISTTEGIVVFPNQSHDFLIIKIPYNYQQNIIDFEYISGQVKIGNELFTFNRDEILINVSTIGDPRSYGDCIEFFGDIKASGNDKVYFLNNHNQYLFIKAVNKNVFKKIYKQNNKIINIHFEYRVIFDNEIIDVIISEEYLYEAERKHYNIFQYFLTH